MFSIHEFLLTKCVISYDITPVAAFPLYFTILTKLHKKTKNNKIKTKTFYTFINCIKKSSVKHSLQMCLYGKCQEKAFVVHKEHQ